MSCVNPYLFAAEVILFVARPSKVGAVCVIVCAVASMLCRMADERIS